MEIHYIHLDSVDSTNNWAKTHPSSHPFTCIVAQEQTAGRGRFKRSWVSPRGKNIYATLCFSVPLGAHYLSNIGQLMAYSCAKLLRDHHLKAEIKWPNDILVHRKKIGGVLTETVSDTLTHVMVGIGLNVNMEPQTLQTIDQPATSLLELSGKSWELQPLLETLMNQFLHNLTFLQRQGFAPFKVPFEQLLAFKGELITCHDGTQTIQGICHSMTTDGRLQILLPSGEMRTLLAGEFLT